MGAKNTFVYGHKRLDTDEIFYIGIGKKKRLRAKSQRNPYWHNIVSKTDYEVVLFHENLSWEDACIKEKLLIEKFGRKNNNSGTLCNMTEGGEG